MLLAIEGFSATQRILIPCAGVAIEGLLDAGGSIRETGVIDVETELQWSRMISGRDGGSS